MNKIRRNERSRVKLALQMVLRDPRHNLFPLAETSPRSTSRPLNRNATVARYYIFTDFENGRNISI